MEDINKTPTPHNENQNSDSVNPEKKFLNFPAKSIRKRKHVSIMPAHVEIFKNYKEQGFRHLGKAIRKTGVYSEGVARRVNIITKSESWQQLMKLYLPDELLATRHSELLDKRDYRKVTNPDGTITEVDNGPETVAVAKGLEMAYKLKGSFKKEEAPPPSTVMYNLFYKPEVREQMKVFEAGLKQSLYNEINKRNIADLQAEEENQNNLNAGGGAGSDEESASEDAGASG